MKVSSNTFNFHFYVDLVSFRPCALHEQFKIDNNCYDTFYEIFNITRLSKMTMMVVIKCLRVLDT